MDRLVINGGAPLTGTVTVQGAKNAVLPLMAGSILTDEKIIIHNCPRLQDVDSMERILRLLGVKTARSGHDVEIAADRILSHEIPSRLAKELRSSIFLLGSVLGRMKEAKVAYPGGCDIGLRPIDIHLKALRELNVRIVEKNGYIYCDARKMRGGIVHLDYPSVGATENVVLASVTVEGTTVINNAAREPEIVDLQNFLNSMGAKVSGAGGSRIIVTGVKKLHGTEYTTMPDRIQFGTILLAVAATGGEVLVKGGNLDDVGALIAKLDKNSCKIVQESGNILIRQDGRPAAINRLETQPYPGFPTDLQAPVTALQTLSVGTCVITETIFETRFKHVPELLKMGADITVSGRTAVVKGVERLNGAEVFAEDLRGGAALVIAGLAAKGTTVVGNINHIDRGYESIETLFRTLGGDITRV